MTGRGLGYRGLGYRGLGYRGLHRYRVLHSGVAVALAGGCLVAVQLGMQVIFAGPASASAVPTLAGSHSNACTIYSGNAYCWGDDTHGAIGNNTTTTVNQLSPEAVYTGGVLSGKTLTQIATGGAWTCALDSTGAAYCWGLGTGGQLGNGSTSNSSVPVAVSGGLSFSSISGGYDNTCGVTTAGAAYCWGNNTYGQLGNGTTSTSNSTTPQLVSGSNTFSQISVGYGNPTDADYACAVTTTGAGYCWGYNGTGELGTATGNTTSEDTPTVVGGSHTWSQISAGDQYTCGVTTAGAAYCWGNGQDDDLGTGSTTSVDLPAAVSTSGALSSKILTQIAAGTNSTTCALDNTGNGYCWGNNADGQVGNGNTTTQATAVALSSSGAQNGATLTQISPGYNSSCAASATTVYCWGNSTTVGGSSSPGTGGAIGNGSSSQQLTAVIVGPQAPTAVTATAGNNTATPSWTAPVFLNGGTLTSYTATTSPGSFTCTSSSATTCTITGLVPGASYTITATTTASTGTSAASLTSASVTPIQPVTVSAAGATACTIYSGNAYCWGDDTYGEMGNNTTTTVNQLSPEAVYTGGVLSGVTLTQIITSGDDWACALSTTGAAYCWGLGTSGQLGNGTTTSSSVPVAVSGGLSFQWISAGFDDTCAVTTAGAAYCWGNNTDGQLGNGATSASNYDTPQAVSGGLVFSTVSVGYDGPTDSDFACGVTTAGAGYCWGYNGNGELGTASGNTTSEDTPTVVGGSHTWSQITTGQGTSCGITSGAAYCWGANSDGQLGLGNTTAKQVPTAVSTSGVLSGKTIAQISAGSNWETCALDTTGAGYCWGSNGSDQLGNGGTGTTQDSPVTLSSSGAQNGDTLTQITGGFNSACAASSTTIYCWGNSTTVGGATSPGTGGAIGNGSSAQQSKPVLVGPQAPTAIMATPGNASATPSWTAPGFLNGGTLTSYTASTSSGGFSCTSTSADSCTMNNLVNGTTYTITATTTASTGTSVASITSASVTPSAAGGTLAGFGPAACTVYSGNAYCWGDNTDGEMGTNTTSTTNQLSPEAVYTGGTLNGVTLVGISAGYGFSCGLSSTGAAYCWGLGTSGQLGNGGTSSSNVPVAVSGSHVFSEVSAGYDDACGITTAGAGYCWGDNTNGQLGNNTTSGTPSSTPQAVYGSHTFGDIDVGVDSTATEGFACAVTTAGAGYCWGYNGHGELGTAASNTTSEDAPTAVGGSHTFSQVNAGYQEACGVTTAGAGYCWGYNNDGQLGTNSTTQEDVPTAVYTSGALSGVTLTDIGVGYSSFACALSAAGAAYCWGNNAEDQLGNGGTGSTQDAPVAVTASGVLSGVTLTQISPGTNSACAASATTIYCWGNSTTTGGMSSPNTGGAIGNASSAQQLTAVLVGPQAPISLMATAGNGQVTASWTAPAFLNNGTLTNYTTTASPGSETCTANPGTSCTISGLANGTTYTLTTQTVASTGTSVPSNSATAEPTGVLTLTSPSSLTWAGTDNGSNASVTDTTSSDQQFTVSDTTGSGAGWHIIMSATTLTTGTKSLANSGTVSFTGSTGSATATTSPTATCVGSCTLPTDNTTYPVGITTAASSPSNYTVYDTAASSGEGVMTIGVSTASHPIGWWVAIPANTYTGTYTSTVTLEVISGP